MLRGIRIQKYPGRRYDRRDYKVTAKIASKHIRHSICARKECVLHEKKASNRH